jgi:lysophospholipase L1-like esterase
MYISFLGDSITTYEGINPPGFLVYYSAPTLQLEDTWFMQVVDALHGTLLVNNSFCGSCVASASSVVPTFPSAASDGRIVLDDGKNKPDLIVIYMGINDLLSGISLEFENEAIDSFYGGYDLLLRSLSKKYPQAQIACIAPFDQKELAKNIQALCVKYGCIYIPLTKPYSTWDGYHPLKEGMKELADQVIDKLQEAKNCEPAQSKPSSAGESAA